MTGTRKVRGDKMPDMLRSLTTALVLAALVFASPAIAQCGAGEPHGTPGWVLAVVVIA